MPSSMTHTYFGIDVYNNLNKQCQNKIKNSLEYFKFFVQGSDPFMFYGFFLGKKAKQVSNIQSKMHSSNTRIFFLTTINYINDNKLNNNEDVMAYLYGYICHYYLDLYTHPFIYYKSGIFDKNNKNTYKYNGIHQQIEYAIDLYFIAKNEKINPREFKVYKAIYDIEKFTPELRNIIKATIDDVYLNNLASYYYEKAIWYMKTFFRLANYDPYGSKLKIYKFIDSITPKNIIRLRELSFSNVYDNINDYLNLDNKVWYCPWDNSKVYKASFLELYERAKKDAIKTIEEVTKMLDSNSLNKDKLTDIFKDLSFTTGINCNKKVDFRYFEF